MSFFNLLFCFVNWPTTVLTQLHLFLCTFRLQKFDYFLRNGKLNCCVRGVSFSGKKVEGSVAEECLV